MAVVRTTDPTLLLGNDTRFHLVDLARRHPGITVTAAARALRVDYSTVQYHVRVLQRHGTLSCLRLAGALRVYPPGALPARDARSVLGALPSPSARRIARLVLSRPRTRVADVTERFGISRTSAQDHLLRLERAGLVTATRTGNAKVYAPADGVDPDLVPVLPDAPQASWRGAS